MPHGRTAARAPGRDAGFTLVELLIVMIIVAILAGIAIPVFLNQRAKAVDSSMKADLRNIAAAMETNYAGSQAYVAPTQAGRIVTVGAETLEMSENTTVTVAALDTATTTALGWAVANGYCITATNPRGKTSGGLKFNSLSGGITTTTCP
jgi:prepilin-type N-terminal cleavage/methylation domain-containing protein